MHQKIMRAPHTKVCIRKENYMCTSCKFMHQKILRVPFYSPYKMTRCEVNAQPKTLLES